MIRSARRPITGAVALAATAVLAACTLTGCAAAEPDLAEVVASWPDHYLVEGTKAEPLYTELIAAERDGDVFRLRIDAVGQGDSAMGTQRSGVRVDADGTVTWLADCAPAAACADDRAVRGFLTTALVVGLARTGGLSAAATARELHGTPVLCVDDAALHPDAAATVPLDPCFDRATGAVLGHWSPESEAFVGPTLAPGFTVTVDT
ncbi:hypothetical protein [Microbacterium sp. GXF7504]